MKTARIIGTGSYLPAKEETNIDLYKNKDIKENFNVKNVEDKYSEKVRNMLSKNNFSNYNLDEKELFNALLFDAWAKELTGVEKRHIYDNDFNNLENFIGSTENMAFEASKQALDAADLSAKDLDFIIMATFTEKYIIPNPACNLAKLLGINCDGRTINAACSGFVYGLREAYKTIISGDANNVLVVASETLRDVTLMRDPKTAVLFADGAGAAVLTADNKGILGYYGNMIPSEHIILRKIYPEYPKQEILKEHLGYVVMGGGSKVLSKAVRAMEDASLGALQKTNLSIKDIAYIIPHQANQRITDGLIKKLEVKRERFIETIKNFGNTSAASVGLGLDKAIRGELENIKIERGDKLLLTAVGAGYTLAGVIIEY